MCSCQLSTEKNQRSCPSSVCLPLMVMQCDPVVGVLESFQRKHPAQVASPVQKAFVILKNLLCSYILAKHYLNEWVNEWISQWTNKCNKSPLYEHTKRITWPVLFVLNVSQDLNCTSAFKIRLRKIKKEKNVRSAPKVWRKGQAGGYCHECQKIELGLFAPQ